MLQAAAAARCNSVLSNAILTGEKRHLDSDFAARTSQWMATYGHIIVAHLLTREVFECPDWYVDELLVCNPHHVMFWEDLARRRLHVLALLVFSFCLENALSHDDSTW
jgi:hypothetical protein